MNLTKSPLSQGKSKPSMIMAALSASVFLLGSGQLSAQSYPDNSYQSDNRYQGQSNDYVTVYEDCGFRGKSRALAVGDYDNVRDLNLGNDKISSMQVPAGLELILYKDERFTGGSAVIDRNISCLDERWNDQASSVRVTYKDQGQYRSGNNSGRSNDGYGQSNTRSGQSNTRSGQYSNGSGQYGNNSQYGNNRQYQGNQSRPNIPRDVTTNNVKRVRFAESTFERVNGKQWRIINANGVTDTYRETNRNDSTIYLRSNRSNQKVEINLARANIRFVERNHNVLNLRIDAAEKGITSRRQNNGYVANKIDGVIRAACFDFRAYTEGGPGGIRFNGKPGFFEFGNVSKKRDYRGRICHDGPLIMELQKTKSSTKVVVEIGNQVFRFGVNEREDEFKNQWYRKDVNLLVTTRN